MQKQEEINDPSDLIPYPNYADDPYPIPNNSTKVKQAPLQTELKEYNNT